MEIEEARRRARSGPLLLFARRAFGILMTFLSTVTIARLVAPREFGLANMAVVIFAFAQMFREFGLTNAVLRKGHISEDEMSFLFWFNAAMTLVIAGIVASCAIPISHFYNEAVVADVVYLSVISFVLSGLSLQHRALMARELRFAEIAMIDSAALLAQFLVSLVLALLWHNVWAIVWGTVAQSVTTSLLNVWRSKWRPGRPKRIDGLRDLLSFGANSSIFSICMFFADNGALIMIGHFLGAAPLGQYSRAQALYKLPNTNLVQPIVQTVMPLMTRLRPYPEEYRKVYLDLVMKLCTFLFPISVALTFGAIPLVHSLLGVQWHQASLCFMALAPSLAAYAIGYSAGDLFITQNRSAEFRTLGIIEGAVRVSAIALGVQFGLIPAAIAFTVSNSVMALWKVRQSGRVGPVTAMDQFNAALPAVPLALGATVSCLIVVTISSVYQFDDAYLAIAYLAFGAVGALAGGMLSARSRAALRAVLAIFGIDRLFKKLMRGQAIQ